MLSSPRDPIGVNISQVDCELTKERELGSTKVYTKRLCFREMASQEDQRIL